HGFAVGEVGDADAAEGVAEMSDDLFSQRRVGAAAEDAEFVGSDHDSPQVGTSPGLGAEMVFRLRFRVPLSWQDKAKPQAEDQPTTLLPGIMKRRGMR